MKKLISLFSLIPIFSFSQLSTSIQIKYDSIEKVIKSAHHDSTIINAWKDLDNILYFEAPEMGLIINSKMDSLCTLNLLKKLTKKERYYFIKNKAYALNSMGLYYTNIGEYALSYEKLLESLEFYEKINYQDGISTVYVNLGRICQEKSNFDDALSYFKKSLAINKKLKDENGMAIVNLNIGNVYYNQGNYMKSIQYTTASLKTFEKLKDNLGSSYALNNIGLIYHDQEDYTKALSYYKKSLAIRIKMGDKAAIGGSYNNIGLIYHEQKKYKTAESYYTKSMNFCEEAQDLQGYAIALCNVGLIHQELEKYDLALPYFEKSLSIRNQIEDQLGICQSLRNIALNLHEKHQYAQALPYALQSFDLADQHKLTFDKQESASLLAEIYKKMGQFEKSLRMSELSLELRDSLKSDENQKEIFKQEYKYAYEKKSATEQIRRAEEKKVEQARIAQQNAEIKAKNNLQILLFGGLALVVVFSIFIFNRFRITSRQNKIIEEQKHIVDEKNQEITDSIKYAKRIQTAILPPDKLIKSYLPHSFVLYLPKDIVAGDFYWLEETNENLLIAACDCTGHGVPGAMVSVVCNNGLNRSVREFGRNEPGKILDKTREIVIQEFEKSEEEVKDGMDISLISLKENELKWAGANNPLWIIRNGELIEYKADKQPIGKYADQKPFTTHTLTVQKNDSIYIFTDGLQDQFGGEKGKKLKASKLKEMLLSMQDKNMEQQKEKIHEEFLNWKGNLEQNDDVCIIGVRI